MIVVRLVILFALLTAGVTGVLYLTSRDRRYLRFLHAVIRYTLYLLAGVAVLYVLERLILFA